MRLLRATPLLVGILISASSCSRSPEETRDAHLAQGHAHAAAGRTTEAIFEYRLAAQAAPQDASVRLALGKVYDDAGQVVQGAREYVHAADLLPDDSALQITAGQYLLRIGRFEEARGRAERVLSGDAHHVGALVLRANATAGLKDFYGSLADF
jgi:Tfp pilus assembly protein PilF